MKKILQNLLAQLSRKILTKYHPTIIGITGSIGKTSAKEAIFCVVSQKFTARKSEKNFNNELGLPLTIIGADAPGRNIFAWAGIILKALSFIIFNAHYPEVLILEMGVDRPGDMDYLLSIAKPHISVITNIGLSHYEFFKDEEELNTEKGKLAAVLSANDYLVVNSDNERALAQAKKAAGKVLTYGLSAKSITITNIQENVSQPTTGGSTTFTAITPTKTFTTTTFTLGLPHISSIAAAIAVAEILKIDAQAIANGIREYKPVPGRLSLIAGIKKTVIIDDTYNAAPDSTKSALALLHKIPGNYKIAVLGDMLELGNLSEQSHKEIGELVAKLHIQKLITVGAMGKVIASGAKEYGMDERDILSFDTAAQTQIPLQNMMPSGAVLLIKGSQGMRMEKITKEIMAEPMRAGELLCRQYGTWLIT